MIPEVKAIEAQKKRKVTHGSGRQSDGVAKKEKVTHDSESQSGRGAKKEKGHAYFRKSKRQRSKKVERSRMIPEGRATESQKSRKVTHDSGSQSDRGTKKVERSRMVPKSKATEEQKGIKVTHDSGSQSDGVAIKEKAHYCAGIQCRRLWGRRGLFTALSLSF